LPAEQLILTFDLGTTRLKAALFDLEGHLKLQVSRRHKEYQDRNHRWQRADDWWQDCIDATHELLRTTGISPDQLVGISLSGRAGAAVFLDNDGDVVEDPWSDNRHLASLKALVGDRVRTEYALYGATLLAKARWLSSNDPEKWQRVRYVLYAKDLLMFRLTGEAITDPSSGPDGPWDKDLVSASGINEATLPQPAMPWSIAGSVTSRTAKELGINKDTRVAVGAHDGICANIGAGAVDPGRYALTLGTHGVARTVVDQDHRGFLRFYGFPPDRHVLGGNAIMAGRSLDWFVDNWVDTKESHRQKNFDALDQAASGVPAGAGGAMFLPYLGGRIAPDRRPDAHASFHRLSINTGQAEMYRAVLEGTAFAIADMLGPLAETGGKPTYIGVTGGGARSPCWTGIIASLLDQVLCMTDEAPEGRGAAACCATALGHYSSVEEAISNMVRVTRTVNPVPALTPVYTELFDEWLDLKKAAN
jgi:xylulokinase